MEIVRGYKVFNHDWTCRNKQYSCPGKFEEDVMVSVCNAGMHFCRKASDCFNYYKFDSNNKVAEVIAYGSVAEEKDKCCTDKLEIVREIPWYELLTIVNTGNSCTGLCNTGDRNTGNRNTGDRNTGNWNTGDWNTGNLNTGDRNTGDWNKSSFNNGCFNTTQTTIFFFNKSSDWTYQDWVTSRARSLLINIPRTTVEWVFSNNMTDKEKSEYPSYKTTGGYLKTLNEKDSAVKWWKNLKNEDKSIIMKIPNFDKEIFKEVTGIDVDS